MNIYTVHSQTVWTENIYIIYDTNPFKRITGFGIKQIKKR